MSDAPVQEWRTKYDDSFFMRLFSFLWTTCLAAIPFNSIKNRLLNHKITQQRA